MAPEDRADVVTNGLLVGSAFSIGALPLTVLNPANLAVIDEHGWILFPFLLLPAYAFARTARRCRPIAHRVAQVAFVCLSALFGCLAVLFGLALGISSLIGGSTTRLRVAGPSGLKIEHVLATEGLSPDTCQQIELGRGSGLLRRHRLATNCIEFAGKPWGIEVTGAQLSLQTTRPTMTCAYRIDRQHLKLVPLSTEPTCRAIVR